MFDERLLDEYRDVLARPRFGFDPAAVNDIMRAIESGERVDAQRLALDLPDPDDAPFIEVAVAANADALVSDNRRHFPASCGATVMSPAELLQRLGA